VLTGNLLFLSGMLPVVNHKPKYIGRVGKEFDVDAGRDAAYAATISALAVATEHLGFLNRVIRIVAPTEDVELDCAIDRLFAVDGGRSCPVGTALLRDFAATRRVDFSFLEPQSLIDPTHCAFAVIAERDTFAKQYPTCERCNA
jgi:hypothetical protein